MPRPSWLPYELKYLAQHAQTHTAYEIAEALGRTVPSVKGMAITKKIKMRKHGERHANAKYSDEQVEQIHYAYWKQNKSVTEIAKETNISPHYVRLIVDRRVRANQRSDE